jgi:hypothetical protein
VTRRGFRDTLESPYLVGRANGDDRDELSFRDVAALECKSECGRLALPQSCDCVVRPEAMCVSMLKTYDFALCSLCECLLAPDFCSFGRCCTCGSQIVPKPSGCVWDDIATADLSCLHHLAAASQQYRAHCAFTTASNSHTQPLLPLLTLRPVSTTPKRL